MERVPARWRGQRLGVVHGSPSSLPSRRSLVCLVATASAAAFSAQGSAKQVYVTGLAANAQVSLLNSGGTTVYTQNADSLGGPAVPQRDTGQRLPGARALARAKRPDPITVHYDAAAPSDPSAYETHDNPRQRMHVSEDARPAPN